MHPVLSPPSEKNSPWRIRPRRIYPPHLRLLNFMRSSQSPRPEKVTLDAQSWGVAHASCCWNHREARQPFPRVVRFKFSPDVSLCTNRLIVFWTAKKTKHTEYGTSSDPPPPRPWISMCWLDMSRGVVVRLSFQHVNCDFHRLSRLS